MERRDIGSHEAVSERYTAIHHHPHIKGACQKQKQEKQESQHGKHGRYHCGVTLYVVPCTIIVST